MPPKAPPANVRATGCASPSLASASTTARCPLGVVHPVPEERGDLRIEDAADRHRLADGHRRVEGRQLDQRTLLPPRHEPEVDAESDRDQGRERPGQHLLPPPLPDQETRVAFIRRYAEDSGRRLAALRQKDTRWWEELTDFFDVKRSRAWIMIRRLTHSSHHRGQQMAMLRMLGRDLHSNYGPTADTGGLMQNHAPTIYAYRDVDALLDGEGGGGEKSPLPGARGQRVTERPG